MDKDYAEEIKLQQHQGRVDMAKDASKHMVEFATMAIKWSFYLNGGCAVAILTSQTKWLYEAAFAFGHGAFCAVVCAGVSYLVQNSLFNLWQEAITNKPATDCNNIVGKVLKCVAMLAFIMSVSSFVTGLNVAKESLSTHQKLEQSDSKAIAKPAQ